MKRHVVWGALLVGGVACASPETRERPAALPTWPVDRSPIVDIAGTVPNSDWVLEYPFGGTRLSSGAIAIGDRTGAVVYFFDEKGRPLRKVGREGAGPGESRHIDWLGRCGGDSVFAWDIQLHRVTVIGPDGTIARQTSFPPATTVACSRTGTFAVVGVPRFGVLVPDGDVGRAHAELTLTDGTANATRKVADVAVGDVSLRRAVPHPLGRRISIALSNERLFVGTGDSAAVDTYPLDGQPAGVLAIGLTPRPPT